MNFVVAGLPAFLASLVEFVEAYTIVLAIGVTRGWRAPLIGVAAAGVILGLLVAVYGTTLVDRVPEQAFELVVGCLLVLFGVRWLHKALLRASGVIPLHDEDAIFRREVTALRDAGRPVGFDWAGFVASTKAMLLEGLEVAFLVITLGRDGGSLAAATTGAVAAFAAVGIAGVFVRRPLTRVPENALKLAVGLMVTTFGVYWAGEGLGVEWAGEALALLYLFAALAAVCWLIILDVRRAAHRPATT